MARCQEWDRETSSGIRSEIAFFVCGLTFDDQCRTCDQRSAGVAHGASDGAGIGRLAMHRQSAESKHENSKQTASAGNRNLPHGESLKIT